MSKSLTSRVFLSRALAVPFALAIAGCSADDVELNGKIFDVVGLNGQKTSGADPKVAARAPLVMPPNTERIPEPGAPPDSQAATSEVAALQDPDKIKKTSRAELERQQAEYCKKNYELAQAHGDQNADQAAGPLGPCRASVLSAIQQWNKGDDADQDQDQ